MNDREGALLALVHAISTSDAPMGSRNAQRELAARGMRLSESSVSRLLREMDERGWTASAGKKGRTLSAEGRRRAAEAVLAERASDSLQHAVRDVQDLLDLLRARQAVESAVAADAARMPTEEGLADLRAVCSDHAAAVGSAPMIEQPGLQFHRGVVSLASNRMLKLAADMMLAPHLDRVEAVLDAVLSTRRDEERVLAEHRDVLDRIVARDTDGARDAMNAHFEDMIATAENALVGSGGALVERFLGWVDQDGRRE